MIDISFKINGKQVDPKNIGDALKQAVLETAKQAILKRVGAARCPEHGQHAKIVCTGLTSNNMTFEVSGCCQELVEDVKSKLKG
jgi:uncharacterized metal-binding protein